MRPILALTTIAAVIAIAAACGGDDNSATTATPTTHASPSLTATPASHASPSLTSSATPQPSPSPAASQIPNVCAPNPDPAGSNTAVVDSPSPGDEVTSPISVSGKVAAFEATFRITLYDAEGGQITDVQAMSQEGQTLSPFTKDVAFTISAKADACLWVYQRSAADGSVTKVVQVPIVLLP